MIPVYNIEEYIETCCMSIHNQSFDDFEVILVDDGSDDDSQNIITSVIKIDSRFRYFKKKNGGAADARNYGIKKAIGKYVLFVDGDDYIEKDALKILFDITQEEDYDVLEFNAVIEQNGKKMQLYNDRYKTYSESQDGLSYITNNLIDFGNIYIVPWDKLIKRNLIVDNTVLFKKGRLYEDELWTPQLFMYAKKVNFVNVIIYHYVIRQGSSMHSQITSKNFLDAKKNYLELENIYNKLRITSIKKRQLKSYLAREYMWAFTNYSSGKLKPSDRVFIMRNARNFRSLAEAIIFNISPKIRRNILNKLKKIECGE